MAEFVIIAGMSGAGRSTVANVFDDLGWFVIDNIPVALIGKVGELALAPNSKNTQVAFVVGRAAPDELGSLESLDEALQQLRDSGSAVNIVFLDASDEVLIRRYEGTRRRHPLADDMVVDGINKERVSLSALKSVANLVIDTSALNVHELKARIAEQFASPSNGSMVVNVLSFGFKHGAPTDVDLVFDLRFLPNPHWVPELRPFTGLDPEVRDYVFAQPATGIFVEKVEDLLKFLIPEYIKEGKSYLSIAVGCTGGQHRSVAIAEELCKRLDAIGHPANIRHRDLAKS